MMKTGAHDDYCSLGKIAELEKHYCLAAKYLSCSLLLFNILHPILLSNLNFKKILFFLYFVLFCFILFYFILFYFILFYFILFYFILFYFILFYFILFYFILLKKRTLNNTQMFVNMQGSMA